MWFLAKQAKSGHAWHCCSVPHSSSLLSGHLPAGSTSSLGAGRGNNQRLDKRRTESVGPSFLCIGRAIQRHVQASPVQVLQPPPSCWTRLRTEMERLVPTSVRWCRVSVRWCQGAVKKFQGRRRIHCCLINTSLTVIFLRERWSGLSHDIQKNPLLD